jgi:hypothetical protein
MLTIFSLYAQDKASNNDLLEKFVQSRGANVITFDSTNIKQFWIDKSVFSQNDKINILLRSVRGKLESIPLKIQLANVNEAMDCKIDVISDNSDLSFSAQDNKSKTISQSHAEDDFIQYHVTSSSFHLEDTQNDSFNLVFTSKYDSLSIQKILLSFSRNSDSSFWVSPGRKTMNADSFIVENNASVETLSDNNFILKGKNSRLYAKNKIIISDKMVEMSVKIKNVGNVPTYVDFGYRPYDKERNILNPYHYPYKNSKAIEVVSYNKETNSIIVNSLPIWKKGCTFAINVKKDDSDIPNTSVLYGAAKVLDVKDLKDGNFEITLDKPAGQDLEKGSFVRMHQNGGNLFYTNSKTIQPGEEVVFSSSLKKDDLFLEYSTSTNAFPKGFYSIQPLLFSRTSEGEQDNLIQISDFLVSF